MDIKLSMILLTVASGSLLLSYFVKMMMNQEQEKDTSKTSIRISPSDRKVILTNGSVKGKKTEKENKGESSSSFLQTHVDGNEKLNSMDKSTINDSSTDKHKGKKKATIGSSQSFSGSKKLNLVKQAPKRKETKTLPSSSRAGESSKIPTCKETTLVDKQRGKQEAIKLPKRLCTICMDRKTGRHMLSINECNHFFCTDCISKHVAAKVQKNNLKVYCPGINCNVELKPEYFSSIVPQEVLVRWETALCESSIPGSEKFYCPFKDCSALLVDDGGTVVTCSECPYCNRLFCAQCKVPWHAESTCEMFKRMKRIRGGYDMDQMAINLASMENWRRCPSCKFYVERSSGCEHIRCRCGMNFCYVCGFKWIEGHTCYSNQSTR
ncbi:RBR-type E3 ubiquitin transferase [Quillaja saponaria]|uniref:RBR-type E3 ubiquitin transferase n=1 Tax=Quillaja saponaria TaxID=32244 RepID=A0AAD7LS61_QUISA|nr:RBR-type E3 ubiquitin transferase [Quillaja saponaria]